MENETQEEFEIRYAAKSGGVVVFGENMVSMRCDCEEGKHWCAVNNTTESIEAHRKGQ